MTVDALMSFDVTLERRTGETRGSIGQSTPTFATLATTMYLEPAEGSEDLHDRNTPIGDWIGFGHADVDFGPWDRIVYGTHTFDVAAPPRLVVNPRTGEASHWEIDLREVT